MAPPGLADVTPRWAGRRGALGGPAWCGVLPQCFLGGSSFHLLAQCRGRVLGQGVVKGEGTADPAFLSSWGQEDWGTGWG